MIDNSIDVIIDIDGIIYYQLYQLGTGGRAQKAKPVYVGGVYPKPRSLRNKRPNKPRGPSLFEMSSINF